MIISAHLLDGCDLFKRHLSAMDAEYPVYTSWVGILLKPIWLGLGKSAYHRFRKFEPIDFGSSLFVQKLAGGRGVSVDFGPSKLNQNRLYRQPSSSI